jgi:hypothetical protein
VLEAEPTETLATTTSDADTTALSGNTVDPVATSEVSPEADTEVSTGETALGGKAEAAPTPVVPESYELVAPDGVTLDAASVEAATPVFKELGLTNEQANKLVPIATQMAQRIQDQANQQII